MRLPWTLESESLLKTESQAEEVSAASTERGATRLDDQANEAAMELRKREGYF